MSEVEVKNQTDSEQMEDTSVGDPESVSMEEEDNEDKSTDNEQHTENTNKDNHSHNSIEIPKNEGEKEKSTIDCSTDNYNETQNNSKENSTTDSLDVNSVDNDSNNTIDENAAVNKDNDDDVHNNIAVDDSNNDGDNHDVTADDISGSVDNRNNSPNDTNVTVGDGNDAVIDSNAAVDSNKEDVAHINIAVNDSNDTDNDSNDTVFDSNAAVDSNKENVAHINIAINDSNDTDNDSNDTGGASNHISYTSNDGCANIKENGFTSTGSNNDAIEIKEIGDFCTVNNEYEDENVDNCTEEGDNGDDCTKDKSTCVINSHQNENTSCANTVKNDDNKDAENESPKDKTIMKTEDTSTMNDNSISQASEYDLGQANGIDISKANDNNISETNDNSISKAIDNNIKNVSSISEANDGNISKVNDNNISKANDTNISEADDNIKNDNSISEADDNIKNDKNTSKANDNIINNDKSTSKVNDNNIKNDNSISEANDENINKVNDNNIKNDNNISEVNDDNNIKNDNIINEVDDSINNDKSNSEANYSPIKNGNITSETNDDNIKYDNKKEAIGDDASQITTNDTDEKMKCPKCPFIATDLLAFIEHLSSVHVKPSSASSQVKKSLKRSHAKTESAKSDQPVASKKPKRASRQKEPPQKSSNTVIFPFVPGQKLPSGLEPVHPNTSPSTLQINPRSKRRLSVAQAQGISPVNPAAQGSPLHFTKRSPVSQVQAGVTTPHTIAVQGVHCSLCTFRTSKKQYLTRHINSAHGGDATEKTWKPFHESSLIKKIGSTTPFTRNSALINNVPQITSLTKTPVVKEVATSTPTTRTKMVNNKSSSTSVTRLANYIKEIPQCITVTTTPAFKQIAPSMNINSMSHSKTNPISVYNLNPTPPSVKARGNVNLMCLKCPFTTDTLESLSLHEEDRHETKFDLINTSTHFQCKHCPFKTTRQSHMITHVRIVHKKSNVIPPLVRRDTDVALSKEVTLDDTDVSMTKLATLDARTALFSCQKCPYRFISEASLKCHASKTHNPGSTFCCRYCTYRNESYFSLVKHSRANHPDKKVLHSFVSGKYRTSRTFNGSNVMITNFTTPESVMFRGSPSTPQTTKDQDPEWTPITSSQKASSRPSSYHCNQCSFRASQVWQISQHARTFHSSGSGSPFVPAKMQYQCPLCGVKVLRGAMLEQHMNGHKVSRNEIDKIGNNYNHNNNNSGRRSSSWNMTTAKNLFSCPLCTYHTESIPAIARHMSVNHSTITAGDLVLDLKAVQGCYVKLIKVPMESTETLLQVEGTPEDIVVELDPIEITDEAVEVNEDIRSEMYLGAFQKTCAVLLERINVDDEGNVVRNALDFGSMENGHFLFAGVTDDIELGKTQFEGDTTIFASAKEDIDIPEDMPLNMLKRASKSLDTTTDALTHATINDSSSQLEDDSQNEHYVGPKLDKKPLDASEDAPVDDDDDDLRLFLETTNEDDNADTSEVMERLELDESDKEGESLNESTSIEKETKEVAKKTTDSDKSEGETESQNQDPSTVHKPTIKAEAKGKKTEPSETVEEDKIEKPLTRALKRTMTFTEDMSFKTPRRASRRANRTFSYLESPEKTTANRPKRHRSDRLNNSNTTSADLPKQRNIEITVISSTDATDERKKNGTLATISNIKTEITERLTNIKTESMEQLFCDQCSFNSVLPRALDQHKRLAHGNINSLHCGQCSFTALNECVLNFHNKFVHGM